MIVTIYQNCKLNNKYKDVFYNKTYLEGYLATLTSRTIVNDSELFSRNNDSLYVDGINIPDFKQYNFLKIEDSIGTFYAFINNIEWINEVYVINYEEDILSNYFELVHIRNSLLTANKSLKLDKGNNQRNINYYKLPLDTESNDYPIITGYNITDSNNDPEVSIVAKLQYYKLGSAGEFQDRHPVVGVIGLSVLTDYTYSFKIKDDTSPINLNQLIEHLINGANTIYRTENNENIYYEIDKIYVVPKNFIDTSKLNQTPTVLINAIIAGVFIDYFKEYTTGQTLEQFIVNNTYTKTIPYNYENFSIGLYSKQVNIVNNGTDVKVKIVTMVQGYGIQFLMYINNVVIDITEEFILDIPFTQLNASALQIQRLQVDLQENTLKNKIDNLNIEVTKNRTNLIVGGITGAITSGVQLKDNNIAGGISTLGNTIISSVSRLAELKEDKNDIKYSNERIELINKAVYCSTQMMNNKYSYINAIFGLTLVKIVVDNNSQIQQAIKLNGYTVRELVNDVIQNLDTEHLTDHYEVFKFDEVNLYGVIAQDYLRVIERVLLNGVRVWCQNDIGELI